MAFPLRRLWLLAASVLVLAGCRLDLVVSVQMEPDGTGVVTVTATADRDLLDRIPGVLDDLRFDDATAQGWQVGEPATDGDGATTIELTHEFHSDVELANLLNSIGPPFDGTWQAARTPGTGDNEGQVSNAVIGALRLPDGYASFADSDLVAAVGALPFEQQLTESGVNPADALALALRVHLPGELVHASGTDVGDGTIEWSPRLDGSTTSVEVQTVQRPAEEGATWAGPVSTIALIALIAWVGVSVAFIAFVALARRSKRRRREAALRRLR